MLPGPVTENVPSYGNNLGILCEYIATESVDLIYLNHPLADRKRA